jgi:hypothetical protein
MLLVLARGLFMGCVLSGFGAALFAGLMLKPIEQGRGARSRALIESSVRSVM